ncbi:hypothetical protein J7L67_03315, partial [bacterium]|nr:hypothetical protein [bacterium]
YIVDLFHLFKIIKIIHLFKIVHLFNLLIDQFEKKTNIKIRFKKKRKTERLLDELIQKYSVYFWLFVIIQQRRKGNINIPAWEGIRLIRERVK